MKPILKAVHHLARGIPWLAGVGCACLGLSGTAAAATVVINDEVSGFANLFYSAWGHDYNQPFSFVEDPPGSGNFRAADPILDWPAPYGLNAGQPARAVNGLGGAFNFAGFASLNISATGLVRDKNLTFTGPEGENDIFRGLTVYSLIGIWSSSAAEIVPIGALTGGSAPAFNIGAAAVLAVPNNLNAFLFLAENDGLFYDNEGAYQVQIVATTDAGTPVPTSTLVPLPAVSLLWGSGLLGLLGSRRGRRQHARGA